MIKIFCDYFCILYKPDDIMRLLRFLTVLLLLTATLKSAAQFYSLGDDPGRLKWYSIETQGYRLIYPDGLDSLARVYGRLLEQYRMPVSYSAGYVPGEMGAGKFPVVIHPYNAMSNGSVALAPSRMDIFSSPEASGAEAMPWEQMLAIHESRHVAQVQFGMSHVFRPFYRIFGEMFPGAMSGLYPCKWMMEGDAVIAETALTDAGRGRSADFLNYFMAAFDSGDFRNWNRWRYGSYRYYTPDHYAVGYMAISGLRYRSGNPYFTGDYLHHVARRPYDALAFYDMSRELTGKGFRKAFQETMHIYHDIWKQERELRKPFIPAENVSGSHRLYTGYSELMDISGEIHALKEGIAESCSLIKIDKDGKEHRLTSFGNISGPVHYSDTSKMIWWSEYLPDKRWSLKINSAIRGYDLERKRKVTLVKDGKRFNPVPSPSGTELLTVCYPVSGGSMLEILDSSTGECKYSIQAPDSLQLTEAVWHDGKIFAAAISGRGYGLYNIGQEEGDSWSVSLNPQPVRISRLESSGGSLYLVSDKNGVNELYRFDPISGRLYMMTSTPYGADDFRFSEDGSMLYYASVGTEGKEIFRTRVSDLLNKETSFGDIHRHVIADELSRQEKMIAADRHAPDPAVFSSPKRYRKFPHLFNIHSWAPFYFNVDKIMSMSYDRFYELASPGAIILMQNRLGTMSGSVGYSAHKDPYDAGHWRHSAHAEFTYSGLYPVLEASVDFNDRAARYYGFNGYVLPDMQSYMLSMSGTASRSPYVQGSISAYIPFNLTSGGWSRGIIPQISYSVSNDIIDTGINYYRLAAHQETEEDAAAPELLGYTLGRKMVRQSLGASVRAYSMRPAAGSEIYPDLGVGIEAGAVFSPGMTDWVSPAAYAYLYGYLPGITKTQGLRLSATAQFALDKQAILHTGVINTLPRGFSGNSPLNDLLIQQQSSLKISADYAIPVYVGDFSIGSVFYGKRALVTPHFDYSFFNGGGLFSAGLTAQIEFGCFFWIGAPISIGVTWSYNGGPSFNALAADGMDMNRHYIGPAISFSLP